MVYAVHMLEVTLFKLYLSWSSLFKKKKEKEGIQALFSGRGKELTKDMDQERLVMSLLLGEVDSVPVIEETEASVLHSVMQLHGVGAGEDPLYSFLLAGQEVWQEVKTSGIPSLDATVERWVRRHRCDCIRGSDAKVRAAATHCVRGLGVYPRCNVLQAVIDYNTLEGRNPTRTEAAAFLEATERIEADAERYWQDTKRPTTGTPNLEKLPVETYSSSPSQDPHYCGLCKERIVSGCKVYRMPCCGNRFHSTECIGDKTVVDWLSGSRKCPVCASEVVL